MKSRKIHTAYKLPNGVQVRISESLVNLLSEYKIRPEDLWKVGSEIGLCFENINCRGFCITIMASVNLGNTVHVLADLSLTEDIWCICPEDRCLPLIKIAPPGIGIINPPVYISFESIAKKLPLTQQKAFTKMLEAITAEQ